MLLIASFGSGVNRLERCAYILFSRSVRPTATCLPVLSLPLAYHSTYRSCCLLACFLYPSLYCSKLQFRWLLAWTTNTPTRPPIRILSSYSEPAFRLRKVSPDSLVKGPQTLALSSNVCGALFVQDQHCSSIDGTLSGAVLIYKRCLRSIRMRRYRAPDSLQSTYPWRRVGV